MRLGVRWAWGLASVAIVACPAFLTSCSLLLMGLECVSAEECSAGSFCSEDGLCVSFETDQCDWSVGDLTDPLGVTLGAIFPTQVGNRDSGIYAGQAIELAVNQINDAGGIGGLQGRHDLSVLVCDDGGTVERGLEAARHLVDSVGVPAIIGPGFSRVLVEVAEQVAIPGGVVLMSPSATAVDIRDLADDDLVWRTAPPDNFQAGSMAYFTTYPLLQTASESGNPEVRVTLAYAADAYGQGLANDYRAQLPAYLGPLDDQLSLLPFPEVAYDSTDSAAVALVAHQIAETEPDVVMLVGYEEAAEILVDAAAEGPALTDTTWFVPDGVRTDALRIAFSEEAQKPELLFGTAPSSRTESEVFSAFSDEYLAAYGLGFIEPQTWTEHAYDATYFLTYALAAVDADELTGAKVAAALARLSDPNGSVVSVGRADLLAATTVMGNGGSLLVYGASGRASFDPRTGDPKNADILRWDLSWQDKGGWEYEDCGIATSFSDESPLGQADWCAALCMLPPTAEGEESIDGEDPCKPSGIP